MFLANNIEKMDAAASSSSKGMEGHVEQPHVLVVDDCRVTRMRNEMMFKKYSCKVTTPESGLQALEFLGLLDDKQSTGNDHQIPKVNMVSTDYSMPPGMNGYELLQKIKESSTTKDVPVVIVSSAEDPDLINKCLEAGALMFISKPLKPSDVENLMTVLM